jgi:hypothetical protein
MSFDLARTLHDAVDGGGTTYLLGHGASPAPDADVVGHLAGRIRRRRAVRSGLRAGVGLVAVGTVATFSGQVIGRRGADDAVPGVAPGTCGSSVRKLVTEGSVRMSVAVTTDPIGELEAPLGHAPDLGTLVGRDLVGSVVVSAGAAAPDAKQPAAPGLDRPATSPSPARAIPPFDTTGFDPRLIVARGDTVVAELRVPNPGSYTVLFDGSGSWEGSGFDGSLVSCATGASPGGVPLPAGSYSAYPVVDYPDSTVPGDVGRAVGAPVPVTLLPEEPPLSSLPDAFPADVPIIGGQLVSATPLEGTLAPGWTVAVAVDGTDGVTRALGALRGFSSGSKTALGLLTGPGGPVVVSNDRWDVQVQAGPTDAGRPTVVYRIAPR